MNVQARHGGRRTLWRGRGLIGTLMGIMPTDDGHLFVRLYGGVACIEFLDNELNLRNFDDVEKDITKQLEGMPSVTILFDLSNIRYMYSTTLGILVATQTRLHRRGARMCLCGATDNIKDLLHLSRLDMIFELFDTRAAALEELA